MALSATTVFEVRPGAGSATNGGGFVPGSGGTDWSQQNAAQYSVADGVLNGTTTVTSATAAFGVDVVGNIAYVAGAWYQVISRTNATTIVVDRATGTATGQTIKIGGSLDLCATAEPLLTAGMTLWIKVGTQTITTTLALTAAGDSTNGPIFWRGYDAARGDHTGNSPLITTATNSVDVLEASQNYRTFDNLELKSTAGTPGNGFVASKTVTTEFIVLSNFKISGCLNGIIADNGPTYFSIRQLWVTNSEITGCTLDGMSLSEVTTVNGCYIHGNSGYGIRVPNWTTAGYAFFSVPISVKNTVVYSNSLGGIYVTYASGTNLLGYLLDIQHCAIVSNTNDGIKHASTIGKLAMLSLDDNIIYGNTGWGVHVTNTAAMIVLNRNNAYGSNTSGARNNLAVGTNDVTLTADPFVAKAANDFTLNNTAGGGAACRGAGFPGTIPGLAAAGSADVGAMQHADPAATGGNVFLCPRRIVVMSPIRAPRRASLVIPAAPVTVPLLIPGRRHPYPVYVPARRNRAVPAPPVVTLLRTPPRQITRQQFLRRNAANSLFAQSVVQQTVLVTSPRKVR